MHFDFRGQEELCSAAPCMHSNGTCSADTHWCGLGSDTTASSAAASLLHLSWHNIPEDSPSYRDWGRSKKLIRKPLEHLALSWVRRWETISQLGGQTKQLQIKMVENKNSNEDVTCIYALPSLRAPCLSITSQTAQPSNWHSSGLKCSWLIWWWQSLLLYSYCPALEVITAPNTSLKIALLITAAFTRWEKCEAPVMWATWSHLGGHSSDPPYCRTQWKWLLPARTVSSSTTFPSCLTLKIMFP